MIDLHTHSSASDGRLDPGALVLAAAQRGLRALALTDHDTTSGLAPAQLVGARFGVTVVPGVELGAMDDGREVHVLGYLIDPSEPRFGLTLADLRRDRELRMVQMVERCRMLGLDVSMADVRAQADGQSLGRPHLAAALRAQGIVAASGEAFARYIGNGRPAFVSRNMPSAEEVIRLIHGARGLAVLAHPGLVIETRSIARLSRAGLDGIEAWHPKHDPEIAQGLLMVAADLGLVATGGSDFHGITEAEALGSPEVADAALEALQTAHAARFAAWA